MAADRLNRCSNLTAIRKQGKGMWFSFVVGAFNWRRTQFKHTYLGIVTTWKWNFLRMHFGSCLDVIWTGHLNIWQRFLRMHWVHYGIEICIDGLLHRRWHTQWHLIAAIVEWRHLSVHLALNLRRIAVDVLRIVCTAIFHRRWTGQCNRFVVFGNLVERTICTKCTVWTVSSRWFRCYWTDFIEFFTRKAVIARLKRNDKIWNCIAYIWLDLIWNLPVIRRFNQVLLLLLWNRVQNIALNHCNRLVSLGHSHAPVA